MKHLSPFYIFVLCVVFSFGQEISIQEVDASEIVEPKKNADVPFATVEEVPIFPGCEEERPEDRRKCFQEQMPTYCSKFSIPG